VEYRDLHAWDVTPTEAVAIQKQLREELVLRPLPDDVALVAGCDVSFERFSNVIHAGIVVVRLPDLQVVETAGVTTHVTFPYIPGLLSFRETPPLLAAWSRLATRPDVLALDGQGLAHPRRFGIACHLGLATGVPAVGFAKSILVGSYEDLGEEAGSIAPLVHKNETVGAAVRTKRRVSPVYVSPGHLADVESAAALALRCAGRYRVPEPTRLAHLYANALRRGETWNGA
jgi:deoxyribonuclease V